MTAQTAEATVMMASDVSGATVPKWAIRDSRTAEFSVKGKRYYCYPGIRDKNAIFTIYYAPSDPTSASEERPFVMLVVGVLIGMVGGFMTWKGVLVMAVRSAQQLEHQKSMRATY
jgi:hypothetical protein